MAGEERWRVLCAVDDMRKERIERTKLEFRILQFQVRERELEDRIEDLQEQLDNTLVSKYHPSSQPTSWEVIPNNLSEW
jgi:hypothetical protein